MAGSEQKIRPLYVMDILLERTDREHMLTASDLIEILAREYSILCERRVIYSDLKILTKYGLDIRQKKGTNPGYYIGTRDFELAELKLLVDAVQASRFITEGKSRELIRKLEKLCCKSDAAALSRQIVILDRQKAGNETIYDNVDYIHTAIYENREIAFQYAEWTMQKEIRLRKNGAIYVVSPWALTWDNQNYYLVAYDDAAGKIKHYRVDKMQHTEICIQERKGKEAFENFNLAQYARKTFGMYGGRDEAVSLLCEKHLAGVVIDRFGQGVWMVKKDEEHFSTLVTVSVSPQFFGWVTGIGPGMVITGPAHVKKAYADYLKRIMERYNAEDEKPL